MATNIHPRYGTETSFPGESRLNSMATGQAFTLGTIDNSSVRARNYKYKLEIQLATTGVSATGTVEVYILESMDDTDWSDGIDGDATGNQESNRKNLKFLALLNANANSQIVRAILDLIGQMGPNPLEDVPKYHSLLIKNVSGATIQATGNSASYTAINDEIVTT